MSLRIPRDSQTHPAAWAIWWCMDEPMANEPAAPSERRGVYWKTFAVFMAMTFVAALLIVPYTVALLRGGGHEPPLPLVIAAVLSERLTLCAVAVSLGLALGGKIGIPTPLVAGWFAGEPAVGRRFLT